MTVKTIIFDLDGTLVDSAPDLANAANKLLGEYDITPLTLVEVRQMIGDGARNLVKRAFAARNFTLPVELDILVSRFLSHYQLALADDTVLFPGVIATLNTLKNAGHTLAICTNKPYAPTIELLKAFNIDNFFSGIVGGDSLPFKKPDGRHITQLLDDMKCSHENAIMVGDSQNDVYAARNAGIPVIFLTFGYSRLSAEELKADITLDDFTKIPEILPRI